MLETKNHVFTGIVRGNIPLCHALILLCGFFLGTGILMAQDPLRFETEVRELMISNKANWDPKGSILVFTGSSSIRMWDDLQERFSGQPIVNSGFGGSQASDLLFYLYPLVLDYQPDGVFIYEGDNDLAEGKRPQQVLHTLKSICTDIHKSCPGIPIVLIGAKPSISRWNLRSRYRKFNRKLARWTTEQDGIYFVDVWNPMLNDGALDDSLFVEDGLHMNSSGYDIWEQALKPLVEENPNTQLP